MEKMGPIIIVKKEFVSCPAFAKNVIDKMSSDSFMSIFSVMNNCFPKNVKLSLFLSSLATTQVLEDLEMPKQLKLNDLPLKQLNIY